MVSTALGALCQSKYGFCYSIGLAMPQATAIGATASGANARAGALGATAIGGGRLNAVFGNTEAARAPLA